jgi:hypothetical protein
MVGTGDITLKGTVPTTASGARRPSPARAPEGDRSGAHAASGCRVLWEGPRRIGARHLVAVALCVRPGQLIYHPMVS